MTTILLLLSPLGIMMDMDVKQEEQERAASIAFLSHCSCPGLLFSAWSYFSAKFLVSFLPLLLFFVPMSPFSSSADGSRPFLWLDLVNDPKLFCFLGRSYSSLSFPPIR